MRLRVLVLAMLVPCSGCAALFHGTKQSIAVATSPADAFCLVWRDGLPVATVLHTPGSFTIKKAEDDLILDCKAPDHEESRAVMVAQADPIAVADVLLAPIAFLVDAVTGALHEYARSISLSLEPTVRPHLDRIVPQHR